MVPFSPAIVWCGRPRHTAVLANSALRTVYAVNFGRLESILTGGGCSILKPKSNRCDSRPLAVKTQVLSRLRIVVLVPIFILALCGASALADDDSREQVRVIGSEQAKTSYGWQAPGRAAVSCFSSGCSRLYAPTGTDNGAGMVLRLLRFDASIVVVQCKAQGDLIPGKASGSEAQDANSSQIAQQCIMPGANYQVAAEFHP